MFNQLTALGERLNTLELLPPKGYAIQEVTIIVDLDAPQLPPKIVDPIRLPVPHLERNGAKPALLVDRAEYVLPFFPKDKDKAEKKHQLWIDLIEQFIQQTGDKEIRLALEYLENLGDWMGEIYQEANNKDRMNLEKWVDFRYKGDRLCESATIQQWWQQRWLSAQQTTQGTCLLTGQQDDICRILPYKNKGIAGTDGAGVKLTSFDKAAFQSWGWEGCHNAPIGLPRAIALTQAMQWLILSDNHSFKMGNLTYFFWSNLGDGLDLNLAEDIEEIDPREDRYQGILVNATGDRLKVSDVADQDYHLMAVRGMGARVAITSYGTEKADRIINSIREYQQIHLDVTAHTQHPKIYALWKIVSTCLPPGKGIEVVKAQITREFLDYIFTGKPISQSVKIRLLERIAKSGDISQTQAIALKIICKGAAMEQHEIAERYGRIAFLMHRAEVAVRGTEDTSASKAFGSLMRSPRTVFPRLYRLLDIHLKSGKSHREERLLTPLFKGMPSSSELQKIQFNLDEQTAFCEGWWKQKAEYFTKKPESGEKSND
ncbi:type I-C CRISPR-associated protein Cas8c/Csd1 [Roseofilum sp. BLCC_M91]|uniref:Type I-C CRISPR-associated protein Cas8c/Csd1 n=1 Tax=Roseofilum halophilum BLCC-M91 TaxID=3022259 RepID=A0ABT7BPL4_9CYAN|nr:type I-C CRISPR-associated protein Cas8c/Csd1 [Roseofilum halophilum]MDJ1181138.1 type I-C CRISPR-associated protein Cas8c/Csd1 [Roseofilum halophilum BLCC-M91]